MTARQDWNGEVALGVFGPRDLVRAVMAVGAELRESHPHRRFNLYNGSHRTMSEAADRYLELADRIDAAVFPGPLHLDLARRGGYQSVPATFVRVTGGALHAAMLRARLTSDFELERISIDSLTEQDVSEAYEQIGLPSEDVRVIAYEHPESVSGFAAFHREQFESDRVTSCFTTVREVERELREAGIPVHLVQPSRATIRHTLENALLIARGVRLEDQQLAMIAVELLTATDMGPLGPSNYWQHDVALSVERILLQETRVVGATTSRRSDSLFIVTTTHGGLDALSHHAQLAPFMHAIQSQLGVPIAVGLGLGHTAAEAEASALTALESSRASRGEFGVLLDEDGESVVLPNTPSPVRDAGGPDPRALEALERLLTALEPRRADEPVIVDAEFTAEVLGVTPRSGRRIFKLLIGEGLAWPLPSVPAASGGRPRQQIRLLPHNVNGSEIRE